MPAPPTVATAAAGCSASKKGRPALRHHALDRGKPPASEWSPYLSISPHAWRNPVSLPNGNDPLHRNRAQAQACLVSNMNYPLQEPKSTMNWIIVIPEGNLPKSDDQTQSFDRRSLNVGVQGPAGATGPRPSRGAPVENGSPCGQKAGQSSASLRIAPDQARDWKNMPANSQGRSLFCPCLNGGPIACFDQRLI